MFPQRNMMMVMESTRELLFLLYLLVFVFSLLSSMPLMLKRHVRKEVKMCINYVRKEVNVYKLVLFFILCF